jgi:hypothetical protein
MVELDPMQKVVSRCLHWLSYGADNRVLELPIKIASYSEATGSGGDGSGLFIIAEREAQMFWASQKLPYFYADTALAIRRLPDRGAVLSYLCRAHPYEWSAWHGQWVFRPFEKLRRHIADLMAQRLGDDPL